MVALFPSEEFARNALARAAGTLAMPALEAFRRRVDARRYNSATLIGPRATVVKSHGDADALAFASALDVARMALAQVVPERSRALLGGDRAR